MSASLVGACLAQGVKAPPANVIGVLVAGAATTSSATATMAYHTGPGVDMITGRMIYQPGPPSRSQLYGKLGNSENPSWYDLVSLIE